MRLPAYLAPHAAEPTEQSADPFHRYWRPQHHLSRIWHPGNLPQEPAPDRRSVLMWIDPPLNSDSA